MRRRRIRIELEIPEMAPGEAHRLLALLDGFSFDLYGAYGEHLLHVDRDGEGGLDDWLREAAAERRAQTTG